MSSEEDESSEDDDDLFRNDIQYKLVIVLYSTIPHTKKNIYITRLFFKPGFHSV